MIGFLKFIGIQENIYIWKQHLDCRNTHFAQRAGNFMSLVQKKKKKILNYIQKKKSLFLQFDHNFMFVLFDVGSHFCSGSVSFHPKNLQYFILKFLLFV